MRAEFEQGNHHVLVGEVVEAHVHHAPAGRPDAAILEMKDLGDSVFYGAQGRAVVLREGLVMVTCNRG